MEINRRGFTLIELLISLAILAALTTIALRSANNLQSQARYQATTQTLNEIRNAIVGVLNQRGPDGTVQITGFVADTGRVPNFVASVTDTANPPDPLNELLQNPAGVPQFGFVASNTDPSATVGVGWNGPYVRLGAGPSYIRDGWGNSLHVYDGSGAAVTAGNPFLQIASWGGDNLADASHGGVADTTGYNGDISIPNAANLTTGGFAISGSFYGRVTMNVGADPSGSSGPAPNITYTPPATGQVNVSVWVCYYGPDLTQAPRPVVDIPVQVADTVNWTYLLPSNPKITLGPRILKAYVVNSAVVTNATQFRTAVASAPNPTAGPLYFVGTVNVTVAGGPQAAPTLTLPHYSP